MSNTGRNRRLKSFWAPFYDPNDLDPFPEKEVDSNRTGFLHATITHKSLGDSSKLSNIRFEKCDFLGPFAGRSRAFNSCVFEACDFGLSTWRFAKFTNCTFIKSSFTQATSEGCEFRDCNWQYMGLSGNETEFKDSTVSNPKKFVCAAYTNLNPQVLLDNKVTPPYQKMRLERTKANVARNLLNSLSHSGEERWYYEAVEIYSIQSLRASRYYHEYQASQSSSLIYKTLQLMFALGFFIEQLLVQGLGTLNKWGASLLRPALIGIGIYLLFATVYKYWSLSGSWHDAFMSSLDITLVAGYTKHATEAKESWQQDIYLVNVLAGILWFAIVVPTLINRISRVR